MFPPRFTHLRAVRSIRVAQSPRRVAKRRCRFCARSDPATTPPAIWRPEPAAKAPGHVSLWFENEHQFVGVLACCATGFIVAILAGAAECAELAFDLPFPNTEMICCNLADGISSKPI